MHSEKNGTDRAVRKAGAAPWLTGMARGLAFFFLLFISKLIYLFLFLAALGRRCCTQAFSRYGERGLLFVAVCGLLIAVASLVAEHRHWVHGLQ